jgi:hypothetical protein
MTRLSRVDYFSAQFGAIAYCLRAGPQGQFLGLQAWKTPEKQGLPLGDAAKPG